MAGGTRRALYRVAMTAPRQVLPGTTYLITRRCTQRQFLLRPSSDTRQLFGYLLAIAADRYRIDVHAVCVMSNHVHLVVTDPEARLPAFTQFLDSLVGRAMNARLNRSENFWAAARSSAVALLTASDVLDKIAYVLANPVAAGLVKRGRLWPGLWSDPRQMSSTATEFKRPDWFFRKKGKKPLPELARLYLVKPPGSGSAEEMRLEVASALAVLEQSAAAEMATPRRGFLGVRRVLAQRSLEASSRPEARGGLNPRIACRDPEKRIKALQQLTAFLWEYRHAFRCWRERITPTEFPHGTYLMRVLHGAPCAAPG